ncbi:MAG: hypothetical protein JWM23_604 [Microbacteriaceae bacterium]|jgi:hypothetical protein|nr:hypothetical protein [Microbacteriaceae bacterium]
MTSIPDTIPDPAVAAGVTLTRAAGSARVTTPVYRLELPDASEQLGRAPYAVLSAPDGALWTEISLLSSVHTCSTADETWLLESIDVQRDAGGDVSVRVVCRSTAWDRHETRLRCTAETVELSVAVEGTGDITDVTLLGGCATLASGATGIFRSLIAFAGVLVPAATEPVQLVRPAQSAAVLGVVGDADAGRRGAIFSPPPLVLALGRELPAHATAVPGGDWLGLSLRAFVDDLAFTVMRYDALENGFLIQLDYEGHTAVDGAWVSPSLVLRPAGSAWATLDDYRAGLVATGCAPAGPDSPLAEPSWWREPIFCGWGEQCARSAHLLHAGAVAPTADTAPETQREESLVTRSAASFARHDVYDDFLAILAEHDLNPGTIVIDDRWQSEYGSARVDTAHWPDLRGWIAARHVAGQKVLLWWKAWDPEGIPVDECITDAGGRAVAVDPANPAYQARLEGIVHRLLSREGLDADGFKVDFTQRTPSGQSLRGTPGSWGIAALHTLLAALHAAAKHAKPDALVICHAMHPSFADCCDMVRLNDVSKYDLRRNRVPVVDQLAFRHQIASRVLPGHPIDTDQWPMPNRAEWLRYATAQVDKGVPALYYLESIDRSGEHIHPEDLDLVAATWARYRERMQDDRDRVLAR